MLVALLLKNGWHRAVTGDLTVHCRESRWLIPKGNARSSTGSRGFCTTLGLEVQAHPEFSFPELGSEASREPSLLHCVLPGVGTETFQPTAFLSSRNEFKSILEQSDVIRRRMCAFSCGPQWRNLGSSKNNVLIIFSLASSK